MRESRFITDTRQKFQGEETSFSPVSRHALERVSRFERRRKRWKRETGSRESRGITDVTRFLDVDAEDNSHGTILCLLEERLGSCAPPLPP